MTGREVRVVGGERAELDFGRLVDTLLLLVAELTDDQRAAARARLTASDRAAIRKVLRPVVPAELRPRIDRLVVGDGAA